MPAHRQSTFLFRDRRVRVEKKNTADLFTASARFKVVVGVEVFFSRFAFVLHSMLTPALPSKMKNVCGEARPTFTFADNPVLYRKRSIKRRFSNKRRSRICAAALIWVFTN